MVTSGCNGNNRGSGQRIWMKSCYPNCCGGAWNGLINCLKTQQTHNLPPRYDSLCPKWHWKRLKVNARIAGERHNGLACGQESWFQRGCVTCWMALWSYYPLSSEQEPVCCNEHNSTRAQIFEVEELWLLRWKEISFMATIQKLERHLNLPKQSYTLTNRINLELQCLLSIISMMASWVCGVLHWTQWASFMDCLTREMGEWSWRETPNVVTCWMAGPILQWRLVLQEWGTAALSWRWRNYYYQVLVGTPPLSQIHNTTVTGSYNWPLMPSISFNPMYSCKFSLSDLYSTTISQYLCSVLN